MGEKISKKRHREMKKNKHKKLNNLSDLMPRIYEAEMDQIYECLEKNDHTAAYSILRRQGQRRARKHREEIQVIAERIYG